MGKLRNEFSLHFFILADFCGKLVDGICQFPDLIIIAGLDLHTVTAVGDPFRFFCDFRHGNHDGAHKVVSTE